MNYYIDFEASQFSQEIIEIGCVDDLGREFHSLVYNKKVGSFVERLTGLTNDAIKHAPSVDDVFTAFFNYVSFYKDRAVFYCYGDCDVLFAQRTKNHASSFKAQCALDLIINNMVDYAPKTKEYFGISKNVGLIKVANYYDETLIQDHNALNDAKLLKFCMDKMAEGPCLDNPFPEYREQVIRIVGDKEVQTFSGIDEAVAWMIAENHLDGADPKNIKKRIVNAANNGNLYMGFGWKIIK